MTNAIASGVMCFVATMNAFKSNYAEVHNNQSYVSFDLNATGVAYLQVFNYSDSPADFKMSVELGNFESGPDSFVDGYHIHIGDNVTNGPPVVFFCGQKPLPAPIIAPSMAGLPECNPVPIGSSGAREMQFANGIFNGTVLTGSDPITEPEFLSQLAADSNNFYVNIHVPHTSETNLNGIIRGQLTKTSCPQNLHMSTPQPSSGYSLMGGFPLFVMTLILLFRF